MHEQKEQVLTTQFETGAFGLVTSLVQSGLIDDCRKRI